MSSNKKISHFISSSGICSRREAERLVLSDRVKVNNKLMNNPAYRVLENDIVHCDNQLISESKNIKVWSYYKPIRTLCSHVSQNGMKTVFDLVEDRVGYVISVGRLDFMTEGLLLLTNSNDFAHHMMNSNYPRVYKILIDVEFDEYMIQFVSQNFEIEGVRYHAWKNIACYKDDRGNIWLKITLSEGKNREIRHVLNYFGVNIKRLIRVKYGKYGIKGKPGDLNLEEEIVKAL